MISASELPNALAPYRLHQLRRGQDERPVSPDRVRKSISTERTFAEDLPTLSACEALVRPLFEDLQRRIAKARCEHELRAGGKAAV